MTATADGPLSRSALLGRLRATGVWDVVVIGGGATGLGCAVDASARGYRTLLLEAHDFAKGTSSRATKLIHGGVRYLAQGNLPLVHEALAERSRLLANAPHLVHPLRFVVPAYHWLDIPKFGAGLTFYDLLAGGHGIGHSRVLDAASTVVALPTVNPVGLRGGIAYWDAQFDDARLAIALMRTHLDLGGLALNYLPVDGLVQEDGRVRGVLAHDAESGESFRVAARTIINATGVWADSVRRFERPYVSAMLKPSQGVHLVVDRDFLPGTDALLVPETADGRVLFVIPWCGKVLIGTTDSPRKDLPLEPEPLVGEIDFILATAAPYLVRAPSREDVRSVFVGLRPLIGAGDSSATRSLSREHCIEVSPGGLVTITGGKWTTYRRMAEEAVDTAQSVGRLPWRSGASASLRLHGAPTERSSASQDVYGTARADVDSLPGATRAVSPSFALTEAEIRYAARAELARSVEDVLARRHRALFLDARAAATAAPEVARILAEELGRDADWCSAEIGRFSDLAAQYMRL
ncbi:MAG TPA: glycerol-3-phosphate dehydrogenase/oxidase [Aromatoleum sp.]|uniref:glycerol-3-phosphate dehydrogenase/oxidase n=1 Tax=Aromatoleum sp. TaxID=2307007 RepID=UPI002B47DB89|nr:glycerol-3-phosphate dehydrogenase/oxidase [Aromatoleum sp.]HJV24776.1 glycerol-3-phosphate dehydrogenase/oxidase [Aromatoleum sp.]